MYALTVVGSLLLLWFLPSLWAQGPAKRRMAIAVGIMLLFYLSVDAYIYLDTHRPEVPYSILAR
jgi:hypothetical protein